VFKKNKANICLKNSQFAMAMALPANTLAALGALPRLLLSALVISSLAVTTTGELYCVIKGIIFIAFINQQ
jgi:hypothetical protein